MMTTRQINQTSIDRYGYGIVEIPSVAALWLAESIFESTGVNAYRRIASMRNKAGLHTMFPVYGTPLFDAM